MSTPCVQPANRVLISTVLNHRTAVHQALTNASNPTAPYDNDEYRVQEVERAIGMLHILRIRLLAQIALDAARIQG